MKLRRPRAACAAFALLGPILLAASLLAGCASRPPHRYFQPTPEQVSPFPNSYGEVVVPRHGLIAVQGDELAYGLAQGKSRRTINGADQGQGPLTISEALRRALKGVNVENRGFPGDTVAASQQRWAGAPHADLLILAYGFGDERAHTSLNPYTNSLATMVQAATAKGEAVFIILPPSSSDSLLAAAVAPFQASGRLVASVYGATLFDANSSIARIKAAQQKGVAQTPAIYQAIAADMTPYIKVVPKPAP